MADVPQTESDAAQGTCSEKQRTPLEQQAQGQTQQDQGSQQVQQPRQQALLQKYFFHHQHILLAQCKLPEVMSDNLPGLVRESFVNGFISQHLPPSCTVCNGQIIDSKGQKSGELDTIVLKPIGVRLSLAGSLVTKLVMVETVAFVVEVKTQLSRTSLMDCVSKFQKLSVLYSQTIQVMTVGKWPAAHRPMRCVFATTGQSLKQLIQYLDQDTSKLFDILCILDQGIAIRKEFCSWDQVFVEGDFVIHAGPGLSLAMLTYMMDSHISKTNIERWDMLPYILGVWSEESLEAVKLFSAIEATHGAIGGHQDLRSSFINMCKEFVKAYPNSTKVNQVTQWCTSVSKSINPGWDKK